MACTSRNRSPLITALDSDACSATTSCLRCSRGSAASMQSRSSWHRSSTSVPCSDCRYSRAARASMRSIIVLRRAAWESMLRRNRSRSGPGGASSRISAAPRIAASGLFISCASVCTYCSTYCLPSSRSRMVASARPRSPISLRPRSGASTRSPAVTDRAKRPSEASERDNHQVTPTPTRNDRPSNIQPWRRMAWRLVWMKGSIRRLALATVSEPMMASPLRIGAATCITLLLSSPGSARVERAP